MEDQTVARATEESPTEEHLSAQCSGLAIDGQASSALKFPKQIEQQQDAAEGRFGGEEFLQTKIVRGQIVFQFRDTVFHVRSVIVIAPNLFRWQHQVGDKDAEGVAGNLQELPSE